MTGFKNKEYKDLINLHVSHLQKDYFEMIYALEKLGVNEVEVVTNQLISNFYAVKEALDSDSELSDLFENIIENYEVPKEDFFKMHSFVEEHVLKFSDSIRKVTSPITHELYPQSIEETTDRNEKITISVLSDIYNNGSLNFFVLDKLNVIPFDENMDELKAVITHLHEQAKSGMLLKMDIVYEHRNKEFSRMSRHNTIRDRVEFILDIISDKPDDVDNALETSIQEYYKTPKTSNI